jgi:hypothetical protein
MAMRNTMQTVADMAANADAAAPMMNNGAFTAEVALLFNQFAQFVTNVDTEAFAAGVAAVTGAIQSNHSPQPLQPQSSANTTSSADLTVRFTVHPSPRAVPSATRASIAMSLLIHFHCSGPPGHSSSH